MNREILFRGKRTNNEEWIKGYFTYFCVDGVGIARIERANGSAYGHPVDYIDVDVKTVGQFTGLLDKNGNKIFEGDIHENNGNRYVVKYGSYYDSDAECNSFGWYFEDINNKEWRECLDGTESKYANIIGNIFDNPELLDVKA